MADTSANINLTLSDGASAQIAALVQQFQALNSTALPAATSALTEVEGASTKAGVGLKQTAESGNVLSETLEQLGTHTRTVSMGLGAMGLGAQEATEKIAGLTEALIAMQTAVPGMLAIAAALAVIAGAVTFVADGVKDASAVQSYMATLGAAVEAQGGDWDANKEKVEAWMTMASEASGIAKDELAKSLNTLATAGNDVTDMLVIEHAAVDLSVAKHISLTQATKALLQAENGHDQQLIKLVGSVQKVDDAHGSYQQKLNAVNLATQDAILKNGSLAQAHAILSVRIEALGEALGQKLIPFLTDMTYEIIGGIKATEELGTGFKDIFGAIVEDVEAGTSALGEFMKALGLLAQGNVAGAGQMVQSGLNIAGAHLKKGDALNDDARKNIGHGLFDDMGTAGKNEEQSSINKWSTDGSTYDPAGYKGGPKAPPTPKAAKDPGTENLSFDQDDVAKTDAYATAQKNLQEQLKASTDGESALKLAVSESTTVEGQRTAQAALDAKTMADLVTQHKLLNDAIYTETQTNKSLEAAQANQVAAINKIVAAEQPYQNILKAGGTLTDDQKVAYENLQDAYKEGETNLSNITSKLKENTNNLTTNTEALDKNGQSIEGLGSKAQIAYAAASRSFEEFMQTSQQKMDEDLATANMKNDQKLAYYKNMLNQMGALTADNEKQMEQYYNQELEAYKGLITDEETAQKKLTTILKQEHDQQVADAEKAQQQAESDLSSFLDKLLSGTESFKTAFASLWKQIESNYIKQFEQSMFSGLSGSGGSGAGLSGIAGLLGISSSPSNSQQNKDQQALTQAQKDLKTATDKLNNAVPPNTQGLTDNKTSLATAHDDATTAHTDVGTNTTALNNLTQQLKTSGTSGGGNSGGGSSGFSNLLGGGSSGSSSGGVMDYADGTNFLDTPININSVAGTPVSPTSALAKSATGIGAVAGQAMQGMAIGGTVASLDGGNSTWGSVGGAAGDAIGTALGGPVGGMIGGAVLGFVGSLFGNHETAAEQPDINDPTWGQDVTDYLGGPTTEGANTYNPQSQYYTAAGGVPLDQQMQTWLTENENNTAGLTQVQQNLVTQLQQLSGGSSTGLLGASQSQGVVTLASGQQMSVASFEALVSTYEQYGSSTDSPTYSVNRMAPNFNASTISGWNSTSGNTNGTSTQTPGQVIVNINNPNINGINGLQSLAQTLQQYITLNNTTGYRGSNTLPI